MKIIKNNNDNSSHLQTATVNLFGKDIDFVNLRKEVYKKIVEYLKLQREHQKKTLIEEILQLIAYSIT
jgi:hypothetical protein